ncbi:MAG: hypothetical protein M1822_002427 [Bathelium mastoideum]|nr:MAG: hypothetical protein M1822_002427 [Bathelium mastoideum]
MDPLNALSTASAVVQFIEYATKLVCRSYDLYKSGTGADQAGLDLEAITSNLVSINEDLRKSLGSIEPMSDQDRDLENLCLKCSAEAKQLLGILQTLKVSRNHHRGWSSINAAFKWIWKQEDIRSLQARLDSFRGQITMNIVMSLRDQAARKDDLSESSNPVDPFEATRKLHETLLDSMDKQSKWQAKVIESMSRNPKANTATNELYGDYVKDFCRCLLNMLHYREMTNRYGTIQPAHAETFEWIFQLDSSGNTLFVSWLESANDLFWITGKPGSVPNVKICVSSRPYIHFEDAFKTFPSLRVEDQNYTDIKLYAEKKLNVNQGFVDQRRYNPEEAANLIKTITSKASGVFLWVFLVTESLLEGLTEGERLFELQERLDSLPTDLEDLFWKILRSLDPRQFQRACELFQIHHAATKSRIKNVKSANGRTNGGSQQRRNGGHHTEELGTDTEVRGLDATVIAARSAPLFPVSCRSQAILDRQVTNQIRRLDSAIHTTNPRLSPHTRLPLDSSQPLSLLDFSYADENDLTQIFDIPIGGLKDDEANSRAKIMKRRLTACCKCLLQAHEREETPLSMITVCYLHGTVKDFVDKPEVWRKIQDTTNETFNVNRSLFCLHLARLRHYRTPMIQNGQMWAQAV